MTTEKKQQQVEKFTQLINDAEAAISINYAGLTVSQQQELREELRKTGAQFSVIKNTLFKIATKNSDNEGLNELVNGPTALIATKEDVVSPAKILIDFLTTLRIPSSILPALAFTGAGNSSSFFVCDIFSPLLS